MNTTTGTQNECAKTRRAREIVARVFRNCEIRPKVAPFLDERVAIGYEENIERDSAMHLELIENLVNYAGFILYGMKRHPGITIYLVG